MVSDSLWERIKAFFKSLWENNKGQIKKYAYALLDNACLSDTMIKKIAELRKSEKTDAEIWAELKNQLKSLIDEQI